MNNEGIKVASVSSNKIFLIHEITKVDNVQEFELIKKVFDCLKPFYDEDIFNFNLGELKNKIELVEKNALKNNISIDLINKFTVNFTMTDVVIKMIPNNELKEFSSVLLKGKRDQEFSDCVHNERLGDVVSAIKKLDKAVESLKDCKDQEFVNKEIEPLKKAVASKKSKNKAGWQKLKKIEENYLLQLEKLEQLEEPANKKKMKP